MPTCHTERTRDRNPAHRIDSMVRFAAMKRSMQVEIAGVRLSLRSDEGAAYVQELADYVDGRIRTLASGVRSSYSLQRVALLVALELADELFRSRDLHQRFRQQIHTRLNALQDRLERHALAIEASDRDGRGEPTPTAENGFEPAGATPSFHASSPLERTAAMTSVADTSAIPTAAAEAAGPVRTSASAP